MCHKLGLESSFLYEVLDLDNLRTVYSTLKSFEKRIVMLKHQYHSAQEPKAETITCLDIHI